jgi:carbonic anhydrase/acetyltransferase-like protein (isoleucine patch superfamily)
LKSEPVRFSSVFFAAFSSREPISTSLENAIKSPEQEISMAIYELDGQAPDLPADGDYFIADTATVIGKVRLKSSASVWFGAVLRGDNEWIEIGEGSNVQDNSTCHTDRGFPLVIGRNCTVGHNVILHGCTLEDGALVGMGSIVMNGARIRRGSIVGAGAVITEGKEFPEYSLILGAPARVVRTLDPAQVEAMGSAAKFYAINGPRFKKGLKKIG